MKKRIETIYDETIKEYENIFKKPYNIPTIKQEWSELGDNFKQLSIFQDHFHPMNSLGSTTLIKDI